MMNEITQNELPRRHPCTGYTAALEDLVMQIERSTTTFNEMIRTIHNNEFSERFLHIITKYEVDANITITKMYEMHNSWVE